MRRVGLGAFFTSVAVNAALGIYAVLSPGFDETHGKILATSLCVTGAALLALACEPAWERRLLGPAPYLGAVLGGLGFGIAIVSIWTEPASDLVGKAEGSLMTIAVACAAGSLLALAHLAPQHRWVFRLTLGLLALGAMLVAVLPWLGDNATDWYLRGTAAALIALAALVISVPVLHWVDREAIGGGEFVGAIRHCPYCGGALVGTVGVPASCSRCAGRFTIVRS